VRVGYLKDTKLDFILQALLSASFCKKEESQAEARSDGAMLFFVIERLIFVLTCLFGI
jgi:hypothetical protein